MTSLDWRVVLRDFLTQIPICGGFPMDPIPRASIVDQAEAALRTRIAAGEWTDQMPGSRRLAQDLGVSPHTVREALGRLASAGHLAQDGPKRRFRIVGESVAMEVPVRRRARRVLCVSEEPLHLMPQIGLEFLARLRFNHPGWDFRHQTLAFQGARQPHRRWEECIARDRPDHLVVMDGRPSIARWALNRGLPVYFFGGDPGGHPVPRVGGNATQLLGQCLDVFLAAGHRHICCPVFGMPDIVARNLRARFQAALEKAGHAFVPNYHVPVVAQCDPDVIINTLARVSSFRPPTAYAFLSFDDFMAAQCFLRDQGLAIPRDVSVILMAGAGILPWFRPRLTHFAFPATRAARVIGRWIQDGPPAPAVMMALPAQAVPGDSVGPPPGEG